MGLASSVIALCALAFSIWQASQSRKHNRLSFRPHLTTWTHSHPEKGFYAVELINNGLGPAIIDKFTVTLDGKSLGDNATDALDKVLKILFPNTQYRATFSTVGTGYAMSPKERCTIVAVQFSGAVRPSPEVVDHSLNRGNLEISYRSFYEEEFRLSSQEEQAKKPLPSIAPEKALTG